MCVARDEQQLHGWWWLQWHGQQQYGQHAEPQLHSFLNTPPPSQRFKEVQACYDQQLSEAMDSHRVAILPARGCWDTCGKREM